MLIRHAPIAAALALGCALTPALAAQEDDAPPAAAVHLGSQRLLLNGYGVGFRFFFKVYTIGLYLQEPSSDPQRILQARGPRRLAISMLREVSGEEFAQAIESLPPAGATSHNPGVQVELQQLCQAIARLPDGLNKGSLLTVDWLPGTGTVIELNHRRLGRPSADIALFNAVLNLWLGERPIDPTLKAGLLGLERRPDI